MWGRTLVNEDGRDTHRSGAAHPGLRPAPPGAPAAEARHLDRRGREPGSGPPLRERPLAHAGPAPGRRPARPGAGTGRRPAARPGPGAAGARLPRPAPGGVAPPPRGPLRGPPPARLRRPRPLRRLPHRAALHRPRGRGGPGPAGAARVRAPGHVRRAGGGGGRRGPGRSLRRALPRPGGRPGQGRRRGARFAGRRPPPAGLAQALRAHPPLRPGRSPGHPAPPAPASGADPGRRPPGWGGRDLGRGAVRPARPDLVALPGGLPPAGAVRGLGRGRDRGPGLPPRCPRLRRRAAGLRPPAGRPLPGAPGQRGLLGL